MADDFLDERIRAEDILLGALGYDSEAKIICLESTAEGYRGKARWPDGEEFEFESEDELNELERWAVVVLQEKG